MSAAVRQHGYELVLHPALRGLAISDNHILLTQKFVDGVHQIALHWPGNIRVLLYKTEARDSNLDHVEVDLNQTPYDIEMIENNCKPNHNLYETDSLLLCSLTAESLPIAEAANEARVPIVHVAETNLSTRRQIIASEVSNPIKRIKRQWATTRLEKRLRDAVVHAGGLQCNGTPTYDEYANLNENVILYYDSRVRESMIISEDKIHTRSQHLINGGPLRLVFSGRLLSIKGVDHLPRVAAELKARNIPFTMDIFGSGIFQKSIRNSLVKYDLEDAVRLHGNVDFESKLMPYVAEATDLFVCCHRQGDPSCTYIETLACGIPIIGYDNEALEGIVRHAQVGWTTIINDIQKLVDAICHLHHRREEIIKASYTARTFAKQHTFEITMKKRVEHLLECCE